MTGTVVNSCEVPVNIESTPEQPGISSHHVGYIYTSEVYRRGVLSLWQVYKHTICFASGTPSPSSFDKTNARLALAYQTIAAVKAFFFRSRPICVSLISLVAGVFYWGHGPILARYNIRTRPRRWKVCFLFF